jgi:hypothetical protein
MLLSSSWTIDRREGQEADRLQTKQDRLLQSQEAYESVIDGMLKFQMSGLKNNT